MCSHFDNDNDVDIPLTEQHDSVGDLAKSQVDREYQGKIALGVMIALIALTVLLALAF